MEERKGPEAEEVVFGKNGHNLSNKQLKISELPSSFSESRTMKQQAANGPRPTLRAGGRFLQRLEALIQECSTGLPVLPQILTWSLE